MIVAVLLALLALATRLAVAAPAREIPALARADLQGLADIEDLEEILAELTELDELTDRAGLDDWDEPALERDDLLELDEDETPTDDLGTLGDAMRAEPSLRTEPVRSRTPSGRIDLSLIYRRRDPITSERRDELWLVGTWRR